MLTFVCILFRLEVIDKCFGHDTVEEIVDDLVSIPGLSFNLHRLLTAELKLMPLSSRF